MKRLLTLLFIASFACASFAQCSSCTVSITGNDVTNHSVSIGQVLCIQPGGTATGHIYVSSGGIVCNQGHINSHNIYVSGGGEIDNYGVANIDTFYLSDPSAVYNNYGISTHHVLGISRNVVINNNGPMTTGFYSDSAGVFINNDSFTVGQNIYIGTNSRFTNNGTAYIGQNFYMGMYNAITNHGSLTIGQGLYIDSTSRVSNDHYLLIGQNFNNSRGGVFTTTCMATVQGNWYNAGTIDGPVSGCGGFRVAGQSYNAGIVGDTGHIDICDAGHPAGGIDGNSGTMTGVTFCQCVDSCASLLPTGVDHLSDIDLAVDVFPNPASDKVQIRFSEGIDGIISIQNTIGEVVQKWFAHKEMREMSLGTSLLPDGLYILTIESNGARISRKIEIVK